MNILIIYLKKKKINIDLTFQQQKNSKATLYMENDYGKN